MHSFHLPSSDIETMELHGLYGDIEMDIFLEISSDTQCDINFCDAHISL